MSITVAELIEMLEDLPDELQGAEVRFAYQPAWPLFVMAGDIVTTGPDDPDFKGEAIVYLRQDPDGNSGYAPEGLF